MTELSGRHISVPPVTTIRFDRPGESCYGLWVKVRTNLDQATLYSISRLISSDDSDERQEGASMIAPFLVAWNECDPVLDADGEMVIGKYGDPEATEVACDAFGWLSRNPLLRIAVVQRWIDTLGGTFAPDPKPSLPSSNGKVSRARLATTAA